MPTSSSQAPRDSPARRQRRRRTHQREDSHGELLRPDEESPVKGRRREESEQRTRRRRDESGQRGEERYRHGDESGHRHRDGHREERSRRRREAPDSESTPTSSSGAALSSGQLARLDQLNRKMGWSEYESVPRREERADRDKDEERERRREERRRRRREERAGEELVYERAGEGKRMRREQGRVVSGQVLERGGEGYYSEKEEYREDVRRRDGGSGDSEYEEEERKRKRKKMILIAVGVVVLLLLIIIPVAVVVSRKKSSTSSSTAGGASDNSSKPANSNLNGMSESDIPQQYQGTWLDPFTWYDTTDFNVTFTSEQVGALSVMGLNSTWDDSKRANDKVPALNQVFQYGTMPIRGVNVGGWLSIEPFITPSLFSQFSTHDNVVDEYTLTQKLGAATAKSTLETHYSSWIQESTFADIQAAGFDHVRIPYGYWAVTTYPGDPYVPNISWRYLLRGIEWARKYGLRINLDLHGAPGSQNGWNHSGRQGDIGWLNGTDGTLNGDRTIDIHKQLSTFFTQPRYKNIVTMYGLVNEPRMVELNQNEVLTWTQKATDAVRGNNFTGIIVFGDGFMGLDNWQGKLTGNTNLLLDVHQYVIFNVDQIVLNHHDKINFACGGWTSQALRSQNTATGFGPTLCGEWSQADTDCAQYLNNVGVGSRWMGTLNMVSTPGGSSDGSVLTPTCPTKNSPPCSCDGANADPASWSAEYKKWLLMFAEAQMHSFEQGWGWFYWTWQTESAAQWSYKAGLKAGTMPAKAYERAFDCSGSIPDFGGLGLAENF